jgi:hypothetical protein
MNQEQYNKTCESVDFFKKVKIQEIYKNDFYKLLNKLEKLMDDEYKYGSSKNTLNLINKIIDKLLHLI